MITPTSSVSDAQARSVLETFVTENPELEHLESLLVQFNIFEALGAVRHEVRHSDFLAYLLNPQENHGLGDAFLKRLLQKAIGTANSPDLPVTLIDLDFWDLGATTVQREWQRIDIFLRDEVHQLSVIIENKINTGEHDDQLARYYERVRHEFPADQILALYLTKEGDEPTDDRYLAVGYGLVCEAVEDLAAHRASTLGPDVLTLMNHYAQMLRRHIMSDTEIARLCSLIHQKHKAALDLIYEHRPNRQREVIEVLQVLLAAEPTLRAGPVTGKGRWLGFGVPGWPPFLYFVFENTPDALILWMQIGPGDQDYRRRLFDFSAAHKQLFNQQQRRLNTKHHRIFSRTFLTAADYEESGIQELEDKIRRCWEQFLRQDFSAIEKVISEADWTSS